MWGGEVNELHLFAGAGGGILGGMLLGHRCIGAVEIEPYAQQVLLARQRDGILPEFPIFSDIRTFDARPYAGRVDIVAGGFPCQDISIAGKGAGLDGERSGLWGEMARVIREVRPGYVLVENSPALTARGLGRVLGDLAEMGFDAQWGVVSAADVGAPHLRERIWIVAYAQCDASVERSQLSVLRRRAQQAEQVGLGRRGITLPHTSGERHGAQEEQVRPRRHGALNGGWWASEPGMGRVADGMANRVDRLRALGNGQVSRVAAVAWNLLGPRNER